MVCSGDLYVPRSRPSSHQVKLYSVIFMHKICSGSGSTPSDKGRGGGGGGSGWFEGVLKKIFFWPFGPQLDLKIRGEDAPPGPSPVSATDLHQGGSKRN